MFPKMLASSAGNVKFMAGIILMLGMLDSAHAIDFGKCCVMAARAKYAIYPDTLPWDTCAVNNLTSSPDYPNPSVNNTMAWCKQNCPGHEPSDTDQWLHPLATWIIPYLGLLLLCPIRERPEAAETPPESRAQAFIQEWKKLKSNTIFKLWEYAGYLGDPAGGIWSAFSELAEDWWLSSKALDMKPLRQGLFATAILAGPTEFDDAAQKELTNGLISKLRKAIERTNSTDQEKAASQSANILGKWPSTPTSPDERRNETETASLMESEDDVRNIRESAKALIIMAESLDEPNSNFKGEHTKKLPQDTFTKELWADIRILLEARVDFVSTILIPVILMLAVTASVFYDVYQSLGQADTAHSLAYGLLYAWLIVLAVASNCYTSSLTPGLLKETISGVLPLPEKTARLHDRFQNRLRWHDWLEDITIYGSTGTTHKYSTRKDNLRVIEFLAGQLCGWACVAIAASCAAAISYTTPTVGIGCRSFNHLLYALVSLIVCLIPVFLFRKELKEKRDIAQSEKTKRDREKFRKYTTQAYNFLVFCNVLILLLGTLSNLIGTFNSCMCMNLFVDDTRILELNTNTAQAVQNATTYWLPVGYVTFVFMWLVCALAIFMRQRINCNVGILKKMAERRLHMGEETPQQA
jgi:hypothetical protein